MPRCLRVRQLYSATEGFRSRSTRDEVFTGYTGDGIIAADSGNEVVAENSGDETEVKRCQESESL